MRDRQSVSISQIDSVWVEVLEARLRDEVGRSSAGQCLRVAGLPRDILTTLADRLSQDSLRGVEIYLVDRTAGPESWRVGVHKVVERRNVGDGIVLALFPPDLQLAAGDSVDISTFRVIPLEGAYESVRDKFLERIPSKVRAWPSQVLEYLTNKGWEISTGDRLAYLAAVSSWKGGELEGVGACLYTLRLVPDFRLFDQPGEFHYRLGQRNIPAVGQLRDQNATPLERVLRLPLGNEEFRLRLISFFQVRPPEDIKSWGKTVASDPPYRDLALDRWPFSEKAPPRGAIRIDLEPLKLPRRDDGLLVLDAAHPVVIGWQTSPPPIDVSGLAHFRIEVVTSDRAVVWESALIRNSSGRTSRRSRTIKTLNALNSGVYFFRLVALDEAGSPFPPQELRDPTAGDSGKRTNESEDFLLLVDGDSQEVEGVQAVDNIIVGNFGEADLLARWSAVSAGKDPDSVRVHGVEWTQPLSARSEAALATVRFDLQRQYSIRLSQRLRRLELEILNSPDSGGHRRIELGHQDSSAQAIDLALPEDLRTSRRDLFKAMQDQFASVAADNGNTRDSAVVALINLRTLSSHIEEYARAYRSWLDTGDGQALRLDVTIANMPEFGRALLISPTHPLRLLWLLQEQELGWQWSREAGLRREAPTYVVRTWQSSLSPYGLPPLAVLDADESYLDAGPLPGGWGAYLPPQLRDSRIVLSAIRARLGAGPAHESQADVSPNLLADKLELFIQQHSYSPALVLNVINPGDASLIVHALTELERRRDPQLPSLRYVVRLFTETIQLSAVGQAFWELQEPNRQISEAADRLLEPGRSYLFPKLTWSRNALRDFIEKPEQFPAHITLILDAFPVSLRLARVDTTDRTSFIHGLVQETPRRFVGRGRAYTWVQRPGPTSCTDLPGAAGRSGLIAAILVGIGQRQGAVLAPGADNGSVAVASLDLTTTGQSLLYSAHAVSVWVLTLDPHLGLDYFDGPRQVDRPGYLLDFAPEFVATGGRQMLLTTRIDDEVIELMGPAAQQLGLEPDNRAALLLIEALRSLSGRLALQLLSAPSQSQGALGMALARLFLEAYGLLQDSVVIPLDAHPELSERIVDPDAPRLRGDLLVVSADPSNRLLNLLLVEAKCYSGIGLSTDLRGRITGQLESSDQSLRQAFDPLFQSPDRIDRVVQSWRLTSVLTFYLERARRYGLIDDNVLSQLRLFFTDLDSGYTLSTRKIGLVFRLDATETKLDRVVPELPIWVVGRDTIHRIVTAALRSYTESAEREAPGGEGGGGIQPVVSTKDTMADHETWEDVRRTFGTQTRLRPAAGKDGASVEPAKSHQQQESDAAPKAKGGDSTSDAVGIVAEQAPQYSIMLGDTEPTAQFGILGSLAAEPWRRIALDLNGCNTISVFGVQGSGKSYTLGSIIEMGVSKIPGINELPRPLGAVVFHYHQTQDYPPEFVSMRRANTNPGEVATLAEFGGRPQSLEDIVVLTTSDTLEQRRRQFPGVAVEPIAFSSSELTVADWRFLMGASGNDAFYLKVINEVMRKQRANLSLDAISGELMHASLTDPQRRLAEDRLKFASRFIDDARSLRGLFRAGRLIIVDLRDEFVEKEQALGLFMTMLNVFSGAGLEANPFNKLIVFDEAHKYISGSLIGQVVEVIREMRHKGVSVVIASQDPVNVPAAVIELSSLVIVHRFNSPAWLRHIQRSLAALNDLTASALAALVAGEAFVWANKSSEPTFTRRALKVRMRPRVSEHGGSTRTAVEG